MNFETLNGFVLVDNIVKQDTVSGGGIYMGEADGKFSPAQGTVAVKPTTTEEGTQSANLVKGDIVLFLPGAIKTLNLEGRAYGLIPEKSLIGTIRKSIDEDESTHS